MKIWSLIKLIPVIPFPQMHKTSGTSDAKSETCQNGYIKKEDLFDLERLYDGHFI